jgi:phosphoribosylformylglycinamidine synthase
LLTLGDSAKIIDQQKKKKSNINNKIYSKNPRKENKVAVFRLAIGSHSHPDVFKIFNFETEGSLPLNTQIIADHFIDSVTEYSVKEMPPGKFLEVIYHNGVIDPCQESILTACESLGVPVIAAKVSKRYYSNAQDDVYVNKMVHITFTSEPALETLRPRGSRKGMQVFDLTAMSDNELIALGNGTHDRRKGCDLALTLEDMEKLREMQIRDKLPCVTDVFLETFGARWSDHCNHKKWRKLSLFRILKDATKRIRNSNLVSAFVDNAGVWKFFEKFVIALKLETHCSPSQMEPYGGQLTKLGGVLRDIIFCGLGFRPILNIEMTAVGEFIRKKFPLLEGIALSARTIARETIRAIADYGNPMGVPMALARMLSHFSFSGKVFALGGTVGLGREDCALQGIPQKGDFVLMVGGRTGNDGLHGATVSSGEITEQTDSGDSCHVQIGNPFQEQKMVMAIEDLRDAGCPRRLNDFGAAGIVSAIAEMGEQAEGGGGVLVNLALVPLKCAGLENWQIALSESQERGGIIIIREKLDEAIEILRRHQLEYAVVGIVTCNGRFQMIYDPDATDLHSDMPLSGEICLDVPYVYFDECPLPQIEIIEPPVRTDTVDFPEITLDNVEEMAVQVTSHFDACNQEQATTQYDGTVIGTNVQGSLYGRDYNVTSHLAVSRPVYGRPYAVTISQSFSPWQFEVNPQLAARNAMIDAIITQVASGIRRTDVCEADNFYTPTQLDPYAYYWLVKQVQEIAALSELTETPFVSGKDSSSGTGFGVNVVPSVVITAMGKISDYRNLIMHLWQKPCSTLIAVGPQFKTLSGSILSSSLGLTGTILESMPREEVREYLDRLYQLVTSGKVLSSVPINRGGILLRLFEGIIASGFGVKTPLCQELFPESYGAALLEVPSSAAGYILTNYADLNPRIVGEIVDYRSLTVCGRNIDLNLLFNGWNTTFQKAVA